MAGQDLEKRVRELENALAAFSQELRFALNYIKPDAASSLTKSRVILEKVLIRTFTVEMGKEPRKPLLGDILADNQFTRRIERRILSRMNAIRDMANLGPHGEPVEPKDAFRVLDDLCEVLNWYLQRYGEGSEIKPEHSSQDHNSLIGLDIFPQEATRFPRNLCKAFKEFVYSLEPVGAGYHGLVFKARVDHQPPPLIVEAAHKSTILQWIDSLDDDSLEATLAIREYWRNRHGADGIPLRKLNQVSHPSGIGRSVPELQEKLIEVGVLGGVDDRLAKGNVHYGNNLQRALDTIDLADWAALRKKVSSNTQRDARHDDVA
jgi:hypothetical protein